MSIVHGRASPLRGSFQTAAQFVTRAIPGACPAGALASLMRPNWQSCRFVEPEGSSTLPHRQIQKTPRWGLYCIWRWTQSGAISSPKFSLLAGNLQGIFASNALVASSISPQPPDLLQNSWRVPFGASPDIRELSGNNRSATQMSPPSQSLSSMNTGV